MDNQTDRMDSPSMADSLPRGDSRVAKSGRQPYPSQRLREIGIDAICAHVASGESLLSWCKHNGFACSTVTKWIDDDPARAENYARAREARADAVFESLDELSRQAVSAENGVTVQGLRLASDNIKWKLARMAPKKYGDRLQLDGEVALKTMTDEQLLARIAASAGNLGIPLAGLLEGVGEPS